MSEHSSSPLRLVAPADRRSRIDAIFTPASPVTRRDLFAGRAHVLHQLLELLAQPGRHVALHGEAGTGKSSLAGIVPEFAEGPVGLVNVHAEPSDTFASLWARAAECAQSHVRRAERGLGSSAFPADTPVALANEGGADDADILAFLARLAAGAPAWIVFDDLDRVGDPALPARMRAIAEATASAAPGATLVLVGRGECADGWIEPTQAVRSIRVARLSEDEAAECVLRALRQAELTAEDAVVERAVVLANGLPQVLHALSRAAARAAADAGRSHLEARHVDDAIRTVLEAAPDEVRNAYEQAIVRARRGIYPEILLGCSLAPRDAHGAFAVADVCEAVTRIVRREVRGLTNQVSALTEPGRGAVLDKQGAAKTARYRFVDPRLEAYILMRGLEEGWATHPSLTWLPAPSADQDLAQAA